MNFGSAIWEKLTEEGYLTDPDNSEEIYDKVKAEIFDLDKKQRPAGYDYSEETEAAAAQHIREEWNKLHLNYKLKV